MRCPLDIENRKVCGEALYFGAVGIGELEIKKIVNEGRRGGGFQSFLARCFCNGLDRIG